MVVRWCFCGGGVVVFVVRCFCGPVGGVFCGPGAMHGCRGCPCKTSLQPTFAGMAAGLLLGGPSHLVSGY